MARNLSYVLAALVLSLSVALPVHPGVRAQTVRPLLVVIANTTGLTDISGALLRRAFEGYSAEYIPGKPLPPLSSPTATPARQRFDPAALALPPDDAGPRSVYYRIRSAG